jgi:hypothetical protein
MGEQWVTFWKWVVITALTTYFGLALVIAVGGFFDVRKMFRRLNEAHAKESGAASAQRPPE